ncbi:MAG: redoxin domain-containing protein [Bacteroidia bacterium]|nr:redoxin domain-containing protein [Bacteroidia bacterium]
MKQIHKSTTVAIIFLLVAVPLFWFDYRLAISLLCLGAYFAAMKEVSKYTSWYQFSTVFGSAVLLGISVDFPFKTFPYITSAVFLAACASIVRIVFFKTFSYTRYPWYEPLVLILAILTWVLGNIIFMASWQAWVLPSPVIIFAGILAYGILKDERQLLAATKGGYKVQIGIPAPGFSLPDQDEQQVSLDQFKGRHLLLIFVRGDWCPGCHMMLRTYEKNREKFIDKNVMVLAIGPDPVGVNKEMVVKLGLDFKILADEGQRTAMTYGVQLSEYDHGFAEKYEVGIPLPASFLVDKDGIVRYVSRPDRVGEFLNPALIFPIIESLK